MRAVRQLNFVKEDIEPCCSIETVEAVRASAKLCVRSLNACKSIDHVTVINTVSLSKIDAIIALTVRYSQQLYGTPCTQKEVFLVMPILLYTYPSSHVNKRYPF